MNFRSYPSEETLRETGNSAQLCLALFYPFLFAMLALLIPNTTTICPITYTNPTTECVAV